MIISSENQPFVMPLITVNGISLYYELRGKGKDVTVVLNNGLLMNTSGWAYQTAALTRLYQVLLYDLRGQGHSERIGRECDCSLELHAEDLKALLDALNLKKVHLAGISYGSEISMLFAARWPEMVKSLFVCSAVSEILPPLRERIRQWICAAKTGSGKLLYQATVKDNFSASWLARHPEWEEQSIAYFENLDFQSVIGLCNCFDNLYLTPELKNIKVPVMLAAADNDILKPYSPYTEIIARNIPQADTLIIAGGVGHACHIEAPKAWNAALIGFTLLNQ